MNRMIAGVALALACFAPSLSAQQAQPAGMVSAEKAKLDGEVAAMNAGGWMGRSFVVGALTGLIGTGVTYAFAAGSTPQVPTEKKVEISAQSPEYKAMFEKGYADKVRAKRKRTALGGGLLGTAAFVGLVLASGN